MKVFVIGSGGREHALVWKLSQSPQVEKIYCAPGNGGIAQLAQCVNIKADDISSLANFAEEKKIDLTVVGPEVPLVAGIVDVFQEKGLKIFGPSKGAAQLEGSKSFAKYLMAKYGVATAKFRDFENFEEAIAYLKKQQMPAVIKADGLAAGKGVCICFSQEEAQRALRDIMVEKIFKEAGLKVVIEECLEGQEASILAISDGDNFVMLDSSQDHKRIFDGDLGPNTGGMGAYSPAPIITNEMFQRIEKEIIAPVIDGMKEEGLPFVGVLYAGLMITKEGPKVLEFNVRFGDPETQAVLPRLKNDLYEILDAACEKRINNIKLEWDPRACVCVVMASKGYPGSYEKGKEIKGLEQVLPEEAIVFHAGTKKEGDRIVTAGGRVLGVSSLGNDIASAITNTYNAVRKISFEGCCFRNDIGAKALQSPPMNKKN